MDADAEQTPAEQAVPSPERSLSRHSSIQGPYRAGMRDTSFPKYRKRDSTGKETNEIYARSLLAAGNGIPLHNVQGNELRPAMHRMNGGFLGDVGYVNQSGYFHFIFNMFSPSDHPVNKYGVPPNFYPALSGISEDDSVVIPNYHPPGSVIASPGIKITQVNEPAALQFDTTAQEGSVLILPMGATREDLTDPSRFYPYLKEHAATWYRYFNGGNDDTAPERHTPNGILCVVTGIDRVSSWAMATFPLDSERSSKVRRFRYIPEDPESPWKDDIGMTVCQSKRLTDGSMGVIFLRVMTLALSSGTWSRHVAYILPDVVQNYAVLSAPVLTLGSRIRRTLTRLQLFSRRSAWAETELLFHPSLVLLNILTLTEPSAMVAIVPDSVWCSQLSGNYLTHPEVVILMRRVIENFDIENKDGVVTFSPRADTSRSQPNEISKISWSTVAPYTRWIVPWLDRSKPKDLRTKALENMKTVLSI